MSHKSARLLLAAIQAILGWEWLMSGGNKLLSGIFPQGLADTISNQLKENPDGWYVSFLQHLILPHSVLYGYLIEWTEVTLGVILLGGALVLLGQPRGIGHPQHRLTVAYSLAAIVAAVVGAFMTVNFHFLMGGWVFPWFKPAAANGEGIDLDVLIPPLSLVILLAQGALIAELTEVSWRERLQSIRTRFSPKKQAPSTSIPLGDAASK